MLNAKAMSSHIDWHKKLKVQTAQLVCVDSQILELKKSMAGSESYLKNTMVPLICNTTKEFLEHHSISVASSQ